MKSIQMKLDVIYENSFIESPMEKNPQEETFAIDWEVLLSRHTEAPWKLLREMFVELSFPIVSGQSETPEFLAARRRGVLPICLKGAWEPAKPEGIRVYLYPTQAGRLPVIECEADSDFIRLQQSLIYCCEPHSVPNSQGAVIIKNYNNWMRVNMHRDSLTGGIPRDPALYRDYIVLLSYRNYSGITAEAFGMDSTEWRQKSLFIRREHEAAHYMTQRFYHSTKNEVHDEIIADFMGLTAALGDYDPVKFLTFLGLDNYPMYRFGSRLEIYVPTDSEGFNQLCTSLRQIAQNIAIHYRKSGCDRMKMFHTLCRTSIADMARGKFT